MPIRMASRNPWLDAGFVAFLPAKRDLDRDVDGAVAEILADVRARGDSALVDLSRRFDRISLSAESLRLSRDEMRDGIARFASGLGVIDFLERTTFVSCTAAGLAEIGPAAATLARAEGVHAHARSVTIRLDPHSGG